ncbi:unnamed protein product [Rotaria sp. Silwood2]|nr:unnamed protein product [Rotaria sp. Silwood2]
MVWQANPNLDVLDRQSWLFTGILPLYYLSPPSFCFDITCSDQPIMQKKKWSTKTDDFFPYASTPYVYWTGYYTSRPALKRYERYANNILQVTRQLNGFSQSNLRNSIYDLSEAMGLAQHHDAVSGTSKQHVANDYAQRLSDSIDRAIEVINDAYGKLLSKENRTTPIPNQFLCHHSNISACLPIEEQKQYLMIPDTTKNIPGRMSSAQNQYLFPTSLPTLSYSTYYFEEKGYSHANSTPFSPASGAYIFRPLFPEALPVSVARRINCTKTDTVQSALIIFNEWTSQEFNLYRNTSAIEIEWIVGPIPIDDNIGKEIIIRYNTDINSEKKYYTDGNECQVLERIRDYRPTWHYIPDDPISSNYYPINSRIWIRDQDRQLTILTDRSQGGGSICDGSIEIMVHRRILHDDSMGVKEALNETAYDKGLVVSGKHILLFDRPSDSARLHRTGAQQLFMHPLATYSLPNTSSYTNYSDMFRQSWSALSDAMPLNVHLLTFDQLAPKQYLVRVEHYFELNEDELYSKPVTIDLQILFKSIGTINEMTELILIANLPLSELHRLDWMTKDEKSSHIDMLRKLHCH